MIGLPVTEMAPCSLHGICIRIRCLVVAQCDHLASIGTLHSQRKVVIFHNFMSG
jgi:hypothetical protein